jgi:hypothetical protein
LMQGRPYPPYVQISGHPYPLASGQYKMLSGYPFPIISGADLVRSGSVNSGHLGVAVVNSGNIGSGQIYGTLIGSGAIQSGGVAANAISSGQIASGQIVSYMIGSGALQSGTYAATSITSGAIASGAIAGAGGAISTITSGAGLTTDAFAVVANVIISKGGRYLGTLKNTSGANTLNYLLSATDLYGVIASGNSQSLAGGVAAVLPLEQGVGAGTQAFPPFSNITVGVQSQTPGQATGYAIRLDALG